MSKKDPVIYRRNLPHIQPPDGTFFVTFMLKGAITKDKRTMIREKHELALANARRMYPEADVYKREAGKIHMEYIKEYDHLLENGLRGVRWLEIPEIASLVEGSLKYLDGNEWRLIAWCIMPNHVHVVVDETRIPLFRILQRMKIFTAIRANRILGRTGKAFWQDESFDHLVRDEWSLIEKIRYTVFNPVKAGICKEWQGWQWSGIHKDFHNLFEIADTHTTD